MIFVLIKVCQWCLKKGVENKEMMLFLGIAKSHLFAHMYQCVWVFLYGQPTLEKSLLQKVTQLVSNEHFT